MSNKSRSATCNMLIIIVSIVIFADIEASDSIDFMTKKFLSSSSITFGSNERRSVFPKRDKGFIGCLSG